MYQSPQPIGLPKCSGQVLRSLTRRRSTNLDSFRRATAGEKSCRPHQPTMQASSIELDRDQDLVVVRDLGALPDQFEV